MRKVLTFVLAAMMLSTTAFAVSIDNDKVGDTLVYPFYMATSGIQTDFEVINTSDNLSVVAKVVVRSKKYSEELRDFLIYLSPNDVFRGTLSYDGAAKVSSTDDSVLLGTPGSYIQGSLDVDLVTPACTEDTNEIGYVSVIQATTLDLAKNANGVVPKEDIITAYFDALDNQSFIPSSENVLTGFAEVQVPGAEVVSYNAAAIDDYNATSLFEIGDVTSLRSNISDPYALEAALSKNRYFLPYYNNATFGLFNFPTKLTIPNADCDAFSSTSPFFNSNDLNPGYIMTNYNMEEESETHQQCLVSPCPEDEVNKMPDEVQELMASTTLDTDMGWSRISFTSSTSTYTPYSTTDNTTTFEGVPSIGLGLHFTGNGAYILDLPFEKGPVTVNN